MREIYVCNNYVGLIVFIIILEIFFALWRLTYFATPLTTNFIPKVPNQISFMTCTLVKFDAIKFLY